MEATEDQKRYLRRLIRNVERMGEPAPVTENEVEYLSKRGASELIEQLRRLTGKVDE